ncbi:carboxy terminal-processing peptidase [Marinibactrum halimedae]|uniref:Tail-specific protease n=1 Tax=Marinibactrum halimedae TaxID=1444977 RepID=A0AA37TDA3_9GAMM|nr:carboxy terminal-processing peptidase [Marinibactrum halimedae]MCD9459452.1 carboxy terminal-processing peptidase [Marinibactrum halimedae]GLS28106.1 tail-specific protease [Marinibactrum halimedae]
MKAFKTLALAVAPLALASQFTLAASEPLKMSTSQSKTLIEIIDTLSKNHYRLQGVDDSLSAKYLDNLLERLDPNKVFFFQSDIDHFETYRHEFDDRFKRGNLDPAYTIYNRFRQRLQDQLGKNISLLQDENIVFDFTKNEDLALDRDEVEVWPKSKKEYDELWRKRLKSAVLSLVLSGKTQPEAKKTLERRYSNQLKRVEQQDQEDVFETLVNALAELYDPHTSYLSPRTEENFNINMSLSLEGIGAVLQSEDEFTKVVRLVPAGPADKQGELKAADRITGVGQGTDGEIEDVIGWRLDEVVDLIRGKKGTYVRLQVIPSESKTEEGTKVVTIKRDKVKLEEQAAKKAVFDVDDGSGEVYKLGVIDVPAFYLDFEAYRKRDPNYKSTTRDVYRLLNELMAENVDGVILDLRSNGGGSLQEATQLTDLFIDAGPVVQIRETNQSISRQSRSRSKAHYRGPLVVLMNRLSASASEIFAGAIQDYDRGLIIGTQSFGKGTVQSLTPVHEGQLKITESKFYRVSGDSTQHRGVVPDITMPPMVDPEEVGESTYDHALDWDRIHPVRHDKYIDFSAIVPQLKSLHDKRVSTDPDLLFLKDQFSFAQENRNQDRLSLNRKQREMEKEDREKVLLAIENKRRQAKGLEAFESFDEATEEDEDNNSAVGTNKIEPSKDPLLMEAGYIMADYIRLQLKNQTAKAGGI